MSDPKNRISDSNRWKLILASIGIFIATKFQWLIGILKLSKFGGTFITMILSVGAYALMAPLAFAIGFVLLIFIHELGHVWAAKRRGLQTSAPMFIPFLGALIMMKKQPRDAETEAYVAFGGPLIGSIGAWILAAYGVWQHDLFLIHLAYVGLFLNLINLLPIHPLDGGRISVAVTRWLWLVGLIGGLAIIIYFRLELFFLFWALFAYELYVKYVANRKQRKPHIMETKVIVPIVDQASVWLPGESHRSKLAIQTYSHIDTREQVILLEWPMIGMKEELRPNQALCIEQIEVYGAKALYNTYGQMDRVEMTVAIHARGHESDVYYDLPLAVRWKYGLAYLGLAVALGWSMVWLGEYVVL